MQCVLMAAVDIRYTIAIDDNEEDAADGVFMLEGLSAGHRLAIEAPLTRHSCKNQLSEVNSPSRLWSVDILVPSSA